MSDASVLEPKIDQRFLAGGGELGALIRAHDWSSTPLGPPEAWPQSLKTSVGIMLTSRQPIWIGWGDQLIYLYNDPYKSIIGGKHPWALGRPTEEVWREIWPDIEHLLAQAMGGVEGTYVEEQLLIMERNGYPEETYYTFSYSPIPDDNGLPGGIICANTDDTARVIGERQLQLLRELAALTVDAKTWQEACRRSLEALATDPKDLTFVLLYVQDGESGEWVLSGSTGLAADHSAAPRSLSDDALWPLRACADAGEALVLDDLAHRLKTPIEAGAWGVPATKAALLPLPATGDTGRAGVLVVGLNPYRLVDDDYRGFLGLVVGQIASAIASADAFEEARRRAEALAELDRAKTAFFSNVSHEFRTPLTLMLGPLEDLAADAELPDSVRPQLDLVQRNGARLLRLVNSLLDFTRIEAGRVEARYAPTDLSAFTAEIASSFRSAVEKAGLKLVLDCPPLEAPVHLDRDMWEKVVLNLLSNAFKFTHEGQIAVAVAAAADGASVEVKVSDTGIGIPEAELPKLFERFHRVEGAQGRSFEGSGIGLALVQELVRLHGGQISAVSRPGHGATFTVRLPFGTAHLKSGEVVAAGTVTTAPARAAEYLEEALRWLPGAAVEGPETRARELPADAPAADLRLGAGKTVLLADDNADMRAYVARLLEAQGYEVVTASDGKAALDEARRLKPDLILTDVMMPKLDGFGLLTAVRGDPATAGIPVVMLSARAGEEAKVEGLQAGADDYLVKPFGARELIARVNANVQLAEVRREAARAVMLSEQRQRFTEDRLARALSTGSVSVYDWRMDEDRLSIEGPIAETFGVPSEVASQGLPLDIFVAGIHPDDRAETLEKINRTVEESGAFESEYRTIGGASERTVLSRGRITTGPDGVKVFSGVLIDITEAKVAQHAAEESRAYLQDLLNATSEGFYAVDSEGVTTAVNRAFLEMLGFATEADAIGRKLHDIIHHTHADGSHYPKETCPIYRAARDGVAAEVEGELFYRLDGTSFPVEYRAYPLLRNGAPAGAICTFTDVTERLAARQALEEQTKALMVLNRAAAAVSGDLDLDRLVQTIVDAAVDVTGAEFGAFFYNVLDEAGTRYTLYSLSGAPREAFERFPMPRSTAVFQPTFEGTHVVRSDDITKDPRYGKSAPHHGMPKGHLPVCSYLAVPVKSRSGEVLGGLFFGHSQPGRFNDLAEERVIGLASQASVAMDNARLFQEREWELDKRRIAERDLQALNANLEHRVADELTQRLKAEEALRQAQKMEAIGQLTGGVAHDFNNLLTVIIGGLDTILRSKPGDQARVTRAAEMALKGAERASGLSSRLLAFSRRQPLEPKPLDLNILVRDMTDLLHRTIGEQIELEGVLAPRLWRVEADQNQLESALINLAVNARDAMPEGGKLTIETSNALLDESYAATDAEVIPGQYVMVSVSDTGSGMTKEVLSRVFEPFYTTKEVGKGTGLGLSMVYGFVKQSGGHVTLYSEPGQGTTVKLYFPRYLGDGEHAAELRSATIAGSSEGEVILLVEDNEDVRAYSAMVLNELGYQVIETEEAESALEVLQSTRRIDLLFTDVVLPGKSGRVLADAAVEHRPDLKVLFTTGYSRNAIVHHGRLDAGVELITKPFTFEQLATRIRDVLDRRSP